MAKSKTLKGLISLFKRKGKDVVEQTELAPSRIFTENIVNEFGEKEVKEVFRILDDRYKDPEIDKLFFREGESKLDDVVNMLETRYMSSERLQAHPLSFNRRGAGAAERYLKINETGERLTDMPGGPGDRVLYFKHYGEMSGTKNSYTGQPVYKNKRATILDEGTRITDTGTTIEGKAVQDSLYEKTIADMPLINRMMKETGKTETEIREVIADIANEGYEAGSPKRMSPFDDDRIRAFVTNKETVPGDKEDFVTEVLERMGFEVEASPITGRTASVQKAMDDMILGMTDESDEILQNMKRMEAETKAMTEIAKAEQVQIDQAMDTFRRMLDDGEEPAVAFEFLKDAMKRTKQAEGGRVGMLAGGSLIGKGIVQAAKLAQRGIKPFGQKQTYKQKVTTKGVGEQQFNEIFDQFMNKIPDEVYDQPTGEALHRGLLDAEAIITGQKLGLMNQEQRAKLAYAMTEKVRKQIYQDPVPGLSNDYLEYMDDAVGRMDDVLQIYEMGGDMTPKPIFDGKEIIGAQIDFTQIEKLRNQPPTEEFLDFLRGARTPKPGKKTPPYGTKEMSNVIPFKPREKKFKGGLAGLLKRIMSPRLEKEIVETGPFQTGHRADIIGDMQQIKNVSRNPNTNLPEMDALYDMVQQSPRYNEAMRGLMMRLVDYERFRAILLDDNDQLQAMLKADPKGTETFIRMLFREGGSEPQFNLGGLVPPQKGPMSEGMGTLYRSK